MVQLGAVTHIPLCVHTYMKSDLHSWLTCGRAGYLLSGCGKTPEGCCIDVTVCARACWLLTPDNIAAVRHHRLRVLPCLHAGRVWVVVTGVWYLFWGGGWCCCSSAVRESRVGPTTVSSLAGVFSRTLRGLQAAMPVNMPGFLSFALGYLTLQPQGVSVSQAVSGG